MNIIGLSQGFVFKEGKVGWVKLGMFGYIENIVYYYINFFVIYLFKYIIVEIFIGKFGRKWQIDYLIDCLRYFIIVKLKYNGVLKYLSRIKLMFIFYFESFCRCSFENMVVY